MTIRVTVWGENVHEQKNKVVAEVYPKTMHGTIAAVPEHRKTASPPPPSPCRTRITE